MLQSLLSSSCPYLFKNKILNDRNNGCYGRYCNRIITSGAVCYISSHSLNALRASAGFPICFSSLHTPFFFIPKHNCHNMSTIGYDTPAGRLSTCRECQQITKTEESKHTIYLFLGKNMVKNIGEKSHHHYRLFGGGTPMFTQIDNLWRKCHFSKSVLSSSSKCWLRIRSFSGLSYV